jgi:hypothetical protein
MLFESAAKNGVVPEAKTSNPSPSAPNSPKVDDEDPWDADQEDVFRVFLATTDQNLGNLRRQLATELGKLDGVCVVDVVPMDDLGEHAEAISNLTRRADLCIHLLGASPGQRLDDADPSDTLKTFPLQQLEIGFRHAQSQLAIMTSEDKAGIANGKYADFISELSQRPRSSIKFELAITDKHKIYELILAKLRKIHEVKETSLATTVRGRTAFVDSHEADVEPAFELVTYLEKRDINTRLQTSDNANGSDYQQLDSIVRSTPLYILVAGNVDRAWTINRRMAVQKAAIKSRNPIVIAKYSTSATELEQANPESIDPSNFEIISQLFDPDSSWIEALSRNYTQGDK